MLIPTCHAKRNLIWVFLIAQFCSELFAKSASLSDVDAFSTNMVRDPFYLLFLLMGIALVPLLAVMTTSFTKIVVVLSIARQALGTAQTPPNIVVMSLALILTCFSMYPVGLEIYASLSASSIEKKHGWETLTTIAQSAEKPLRNFLSAHARQEDRDLFFGIMKEQPNNTAAVAPDDFIILAPAFLISELALAFQIGFLIYLPFLVIDMTIANLLMALGMQMLAPTTVSLPFKILLFVLVDGWRLLSEGLVKV